MDNSTIPDNFASNNEKLSDEYGLKYARYIDGNHFRTDDDELIENELYASGYQTDEKIKKQLLKGRDESYGYMSFEQPVIIPKFLKAVKKNLNVDLFESKVKAIDAKSMDEKNREKDKLMGDLLAKDIDREFSKILNQDMSSNQKQDFEPESMEDIDIYMEVEHQLPQEIAMEQAISVVKEANYHREIVDQLVDDVSVYGKCVTMEDYDPDLGVKIKRINPLVFTTSYDTSEMRDSRGSFYNGHYELMTITDIHRQYGIDKEVLIKWAGTTARHPDVMKRANRDKWSDVADALVEVLFFEFKTTFTEVYSKRIKENNSKIQLKERDEDYDFTRDNVETIRSVRESWMEGVWIIDSDILLDYGVRTNQVIDSLKKIRSKYSFYDTGEMSMVRKMIPHADAMALAMIKMNQMIASAKPKGLAINISSLLEVPSGADGSGEALSYLTLVEMYNDTGTQLFRQDEFSAGQGLPLVELENGLPRDFSKYMDLYNHNLQQLNTITGINDLVAGMGASSRVSSESNKMALQSSIKSVEYVRDAVLSVEKTLSENILIRIQDIDEYDKPFKKYVQAIGSFHMDKLMELDGLHPYTFSLYIDMRPDDEELTKLYEDMSIAIQSGQITIADKIEIQHIKNLKLASLVLRRKIKKNVEAAQKNEMEKIKAQKEAEMMKVQNELQVIQAKGQADLQVANLKGEWDYKIALLKYQSEQQANQMKVNATAQMSQAQMAQKNQLTKFQQDKMDARQREKLSAMEKEQLSSGAERNIAGRNQV